MDWSASLTLVAPETLLSISGLVLLLVAAWVGDRHARGVSWLATAVLFGAGLMVAPALCGGAMGADTQAFFDQFRADAFASFANNTSFFYYLWFRSRTNTVSNRAAHCSRLAAVAYFNCYVLSSHC